MQITKKVASGGLFLPRNLLKRGPPEFQHVGNGGEVGHDEGEAEGDEHVASEEERVMNKKKKPVSIEKFRLSSNFLDRSKKSFSVSQLSKCVGAISLTHSLPPPPIQE